MRFRIDEKWYPWMIGGLSLLVSLLIFAVAILAVDTYNSGTETKAVLARNLRATCAFYESAAVSVVSDEAETQVALAARVAYRGRGCITPVLPFPSSNLKREAHQFGFLVTP